MLINSDITLMRFIKLNIIIFRLAFPLRLSSNVMTVEVSRKPPHRVSWDENLIENDENTPLISNQSTMAANGSALNFVSSKQRYR